MNSQNPPAPTRGCVHRRPPVALVVAILALVLATGTTSYAAGVARNSVGAPQLKANAVTSTKIRTGAVTRPDLRNGAVTGAKVRDRSIGRADLVPGVVPGRTVSASVEISPGEERTLATLAGIRYTAGCGTTAAPAAVASLEVEVASSSDDLNPLSGSYIAARQDGGEQPVIRPSGVASEFAGTSFITDTPSSTAGHTSVTGVLQHVGQLPVRMDLAATAVGGADRRCSFRAVLTPLG